MENLIKWVSNWYSQQCDGDWEHSHNIVIRNLDNPGWEVVIDLEGTELDGIDIQYTLKEYSETEWHGYKTESNKFIAFGSVMQLEQLFIIFKTLVENKSLLQS